MKQARSTDDSPADHEALTPDATLDEASVSATARATKRKVTPLAEHYFDQGEIGQGGMGTVRRVLDRTLLRTVAMKILHRERGEGRVRRFCKEAQITGQLDHPHIAPIYELGQGEYGQPYFCMKLVEGRTLEELIEELGEDRLLPAHLSRLLGIFSKVCDALAFAHSRGVIHRDIKPSNIMVGDYGQVYLMDWGVAHLLPDPAPGVRSDRRVRVADDLIVEEPSGAVVGTPRYMSPEQVEGRHDQIGPTSDVFSLGATLYHVLAGHSPYRGDDGYIKLLLAVVSGRYLPLEEAVPSDRLPKPLVAIVEKAMRCEPENRYSSVTEMQEALETFRHSSWHLPIRHYAPGEKIVRQGEEGDLAFVITEGNCVVLDESKMRRMELRRLGKGDVFGEMAVFSSAKRTATVEAVDNVAVMVVGHEVLSSGLGLDSWMGSFVRALAERFSEVDRRLREAEREVEREVERE